MNVHFPAQRRNWPGRLVNLVVVLVVLALAAATFVLSYSGVHAIVAQAGVSARLARVYPGLFDALFVVACVAAVMLRDARWWARLYAWLVIIGVVAVVGAADAVHAMNVTLPHRKTEGVVAAAPWVLVLLGFSVMLTMFRQSRAVHADGKTAAAGQAHAAPEAPRLPEVETAERADAAQEAGASADVDESAAAESEPEPAPDGELAEAGAESGAATQEIFAALPAYGYVEGDSGNGPAGDEHPRTVPGQVVDEDAPPFATAPFATVPRLNRVRSTPTPPQDGDEEE